MSNFKTFMNLTSIYVGLLPYKEYKYERYDRDNLPVPRFGIKLPPIKCWLGVMRIENLEIPVRYCGEGIYIFGDYAFISEEELTKQDLENVEYVLNEKQDLICIYLTGKLTWPASYTDIDDKSNRVKEKNKLLSKHLGLDNITKESTVKITSMEDIDVPFLTKETMNEEFSDTYKVAFQDHTYQGENDDLIYASKYENYQEIERFDLDHPRRVFTVMYDNTVAFGAKLANSLYYIILSKPLPDKYVWGDYNFQYCDILD